jgi:hypothetical protein
MKALVSVRWIFAVAALAMLSGCCGLSLCDSARWEYRYRVFKAAEEMPSMLEGPIDADILSQRFLPASDVNKAMDDLTKEGFKLVKIERIKDTPYCTFVLRRPLTVKMRPMKAPMEYIGTYQVQPPNAQTIYYSLSPTYYGYMVVIFNGSETPRVLETTWDGDKLVCTEGDLHHTFLLSGDGFAIAHAEEKILPDRLERKIFNARRIQTGKP